ncbi:hypothetical protein HZS_6731, partial [Henneguya salminicola]
MKTNFNFVPVIVHVNDHFNEEIMKKMTEFIDNNTGFKLQTIETVKNVCIDKQQQILDLLSEYSKSISVKKILFGVSGSHCCIKALESLANGDALKAIEFSKPEFRHNGIIFIRPLKNFLPKELGLFFSLNKLESFHYDTQNLNVNILIKFKAHKTS